MTARVPVVAAPAHAPIGEGLNARLFLKTANAFAGIIALGLMGLVVDLVFRFVVARMLRRHALPFWKYPPGLELAVRIGERALPSLPCHGRSSISIVPVDDS